MSKSALLLYPNQLFAVDELPEGVDEIVLVEEPLVFGTDQQYKMYVHKQKLVFHRATMRRYVEEELWPAGYQVDYIECNRMNESADVVEKLKQFDEVFVFEFNDDVLSRRLMDALKTHPEAPQLSVLISPNFFLSSEESDGFFTDNKTSTFPKFYQWQRERFNILINPDTYKPLEGKWNAAPKKQRRIPKTTTLPSFEVYGTNDYVTEATDYIERHFADNPGTLDGFPWPTNRNEAKKWLHDFLHKRLIKYSQYQEAIDGEAPWLYHSAIAPLLNVGLLNPVDVVDTAIAANDKLNAPIEDLECFVRTILGWREYMRGVYRKRHVSMRTSNTFNHQRRLTADWYHGTTGIDPVDDVIHKLQTRAYTHQVERLMVMGNMMFLSEIHPDDVYRWSMEMYIDATDWSVVPNVYGMSQGAAFSTLKTPPAISSSNYILSMSHYQKDGWCDTWDGLYWRAIEKHRDILIKDPGMKKAVAQLARVNKNRRRVISYRAEDFLNTKTSN